MPDHNFIISNSSFTINPLNVWGNSLEKFNHVPQNVLSMGSSTAACLRAANKTYVPYSTPEMRDSYRQKNASPIFYQNPVEQKSAELEFSDKMVREGCWWYRIKPSANK